MTKVSIIIPVYNVEEYICDALDSCVNQTLKDIEMICVDDCSPDGCPAILDEYAQRDSRVKVIHLKENGGAGNARNIALDIASGEYIMFLDPDDWLELDACELAYKQIKQNGDDFVYFNMYTFDEGTGNRNLLDSRLKSFREFYGVGSFSLKDVEELNLSFGESWYKIYNRKFLCENNICFSPHKLLEDVPFYMKAVVCSNTVSILDKPLYYYRIRSTSAVNRKDLEYSEIFAARRTAYDIVCDSDYPKYVYSYIVAYIKSILYYFGRINPKEQLLADKYYKEMQNLFICLDKTHDISKIKDYIPYKKFKHIIKYSYQEYKFSRFIKNIFSISKDETCKYMILLGRKYVLVKYNLITIKPKDKIRRGDKPANSTEIRGGGTL